jgi:hypothetical protein
MKVCGQIDNTDPGLQDATGWQVFIIHFCRERGETA